MITFCGCTGTGWRAKVDAAVSAFGHRNWIVIVDAAYPKQSAPGIKTIVIDEGHLEVLAAVLDRVERAPHVRAIVLLDKELRAVAEGRLVPAAPGEPVPLARGRGRLRWWQAGRWSLDAHGGNVRRDPRAHLPRR